MKTIRSHYSFSLRALSILGAAFCLSFAPALQAATLHGNLDVAGGKSKKFGKNVLVTLYEATEFTPLALATTQTDSSGDFRIEIAKEKSDSIFFLSANLSPEVRFMAVLGEELPTQAVVNELTTVAASYSMAQFFRTGQIAGSAYRLQIAAQMVPNIVDPATGQVSDVLLTSPNADETNSLRLTRSLGNVLNACVRNSTALTFFLQATDDEYGRTPIDTAEALANLARDPSQNASWIYSMSKYNRPYKPDLTSEPDNWSVTVKLNRTGRDDVFFGGAANVAWDSRGYAWVANNVVQGTPNSTTYNVVLKPDGTPSDGTNGTPDSPISGGGLLGVGWGVTIDHEDNAWFGNFGWGKPKSQTYPTQREGGKRGAGTGSVSRFLPDGTPTSENGYYGPLRVQGIEPDIYNNIWMASLGDTDRALGSGVWVYRNGDPTDVVSSIVDWEYAPFGVAPVPNGNAAWVTFSGGLAGQNQSGLAKYRLNEDGSLEQTFYEDLGKTLKIVTVDFAGNAWVASQGTSSIFAFSPDGTKLGEYTGGGIFGPWGLAVDGEGNIWISNFGDIAPNNDYSYGRVSKICGANPAAWPEGMTMGDPISPNSGYTVPNEGDEVLLPNGDPLYGPGAPPSYKPIMRQTSVQIDAAGNLWSINNWKPRFDVDATVNPGGDGIIIFVGIAPPPPLQF